LLWLVALALLGSLISLYYYLIVLKVVFADEPAQQETSPLRGHAAPKSNVGGSIDEGGDFLQRVSLSVLGAIVIFLGVIPGPLVDRIIASLP